jgi:D-3-phosphoglycerate dehydrogenase
VIAENIIMKILVSEPLEQSCVEILRSDGFTVDHRPDLTAGGLRDIIGEYDGLVVRSATKVTSEIIGRAARMRVIGRAGTGVDNIDVAAATRRGILVINTPGGNTVSAAEHTISMMLALARNIPQAHASLVQGRWDRKNFTGTEVFEKTIGLVGLGKIGREVAVRCQGLGMRVIGYDPVLGVDVAAKLNIELVSLEELYRRSDFISVHTPLTPETRGLLNDDTLSLCKKGVRVINCARGGIVDEGALLRAIDAGHVGGAALDVFATEPPSGSPLLGHSRIVVTPHLGASTEEAQEKVAIQIAHQIADALKGRGYSGVVNSAALQYTVNQDLRPYVLLAEKVGSLVAQMTPGKLRSITVGSYGDLLTSSMEILTSGILKGILSHQVPDPVNFVNAPMLAEEMGVLVSEQRDPDGENFTNLLRVRYETDREVNEVAGTVFGSTALRLVRMNRFTFEVRPEGYLLVYYNIDRPGMLARIGAILARHQVNIAGVSLGRTGLGENALTVMNIDTNVPDPVLDELHGVEGVSNLRVVRLD